MNALKSVARTQRVNTIIFSYYADDVSTLYNVVVLVNCCFTSLFGNNGHLSDNVISYNVSNLLFQLLFMTLEHYAFVIVTL